MKLSLSEDNTVVDDDNVHRGAGSLWTQDLTSITEKALVQKKELVNV